MINPCLPHAERVRLGLTPADPNYMAPKIYNPDAPINAEQRKKNAEAAGKRESHADAVREFSPWELEEIRLDLLKLGSLRAERFVTLIDTYEAAQDFRQTVSAALDEVDTEDLNGRISEATDEIGAELSREVADQIVELTASDPQANAEAVLKWYEGRIKEIRKEVTDHLDKLHAWSVDAEAAIAPLNLT